MTFVRKNVAVKLENTSNRANYGNNVRCSAFCVVVLISSQIAPFIDRFAAWKPTDRPIHPHPHIGVQFTSVCLFCFRCKTNPTIRCG